MASVSGAHSSPRVLLDIIPHYTTKTKPASEIGVRGGTVKQTTGGGGRRGSGGGGVAGSSGRSDEHHTRAGAPSTPSTSRFPKLEECAHFHYEQVELRSIQLSLIEEELEKACRSSGEADGGVTLKVTSGSEQWQIRRSFEHFAKLDRQLHMCVFDRDFSQLPVLSKLQPKTDEERRSLLREYVSRLSWIGSETAISCGPALSWFELDNRGHRIISAGQEINTPAVAAAFATVPYTAAATDELSFQMGDMISVIDMPPAEESRWWRGKRGFLVGFFPSNCVAVITDKIPTEIPLAEPTKPVLRKHGKLIAFFRAFILSRPSRRRLKQSGILRERVFGCDLSEHLLNSAREIPLVLKCCSEFIESHGIVDGIYRLSGVSSNIQRLRSVFDEDRIPVLTEESQIKEDIHSVASLLKMYFRELPNPLCTYQLYDEFVQAVQAVPSQRLARMRQTVRKLPPPHYRTLEYLMGHLGRVCSHSNATGMTARNVAIVWAPNLLRCRSLDQGVAALQGVGVQAVVTEFLILFYKAIFYNCELDESQHPKSLAVCTPTKLLSLEEAQARGNSRLATPHFEGIYVGTVEKDEMRAETRSYHTVLELRRKRPALSWRTIFTPRRRAVPGGGGQTSSPRRFKRKQGGKSGEGGTEPGSHSRSVSHDSYFDTSTLSPLPTAASVGLDLGGGGSGPPSSPSVSSLAGEAPLRQGLSLSLDLSELAMNFEMEESSEMRLLSEDESTTHAASEGGSSSGGGGGGGSPCAGGGPGSPPPPLPPLSTPPALLDNLEERFSSQELRYIDSYSPEPTDSLSDTSPRYQPLLTPSSYENLRANQNGDCLSSQRTSGSYVYEKLTESPGDECGYKELSCKNDLYEDCGGGGEAEGGGGRQETEEEMEVGGSYEPIASPHLYQNHTVSSSAGTADNIYEDLNQLTPSEVYCQVKYFKNSVEELNRLVSSAEARQVDRPPSATSSSERKDCASQDEEEEDVDSEKTGDEEEVEGGGYEEMISSPGADTPEECPPAKTSVPDNRRGATSLAETSVDANYEIVDFSFSQESKTRDNNIRPSSTSHIDSKCDTILSNRVSSSSSSGGEADREGSGGSYKFGRVSDLSSGSEPVERQSDLGMGGDGEVSSGTVDEGVTRRTGSDQVSSRTVPCGAAGEVEVARDVPSRAVCMELPIRTVDVGFPSRTVCRKVPCGTVDKGISSRTISDPSRNEDREMSRGTVVGELYSGTAGGEVPSRTVGRQVPSGKVGGKLCESVGGEVSRETVGGQLSCGSVAGEVHCETGGGKVPSGTKGAPLSGGGGRVGAGGGESDSERRERIEKYKEERRNFFRQKYGGGGGEGGSSARRALGDQAEDPAGDDLIRRIKEKTLQPKSPTKTTVSISYTPARFSLASPTSSAPPTAFTNEKKEGSPPPANS